MRTVELLIHPNKLSGYGDFDFVPELTIRRSRPVKNFLNLLYASEPGETASSMLPVQTKITSQSTQPIDLTLGPDHTSNPSDRPAIIKTHAPSTVNLPTKSEPEVPSIDPPTVTSIPPSEPLVDENINYVIISSPQSTIADPEEQL
ncbi:unnamed protein product [Ilex paraguariensis]|uniref:Uncharacterized protein n=1 Tax=Ilex paraguariensis TaxID=185542 RepID=A0ABC8R693_9AQUA